MSVFPVRAQHTGTLEQRDIILRLLEGRSFSVICSANRYGGDDPATGAPPPGLTIGFNGKTGEWYDPPEIHFGVNVGLFGTDYQIEEAQADAQIHFVEAPVFRMAWTEDNRFSRRLTLGGVKRSRPAGTSTDGIIELGVGPDGLLSAPIVKYATNVGTGGDRELYFNANPKYGVYVWHYEFVGWLAPGPDQWSPNLRGEWRTIVWTSHTMQTADTLRAEVELSTGGLDSLGKEEAKKLFAAVRKLDDGAWKWAVDAVEFPGGSPPPSLHYQTVVARYGTYPGGVAYGEPPAVLGPDHAGDNARGMCEALNGGRSCAAGDADVFRLPAPGEERAVLDYSGRYAAAKHRGYVPTACSGGWFGGGAPAPPSSTSGRAPNGGAIGDSANNLKLAEKPTADLPADRLRMLRAWWATNCPDQPLPERVPSSGFRCDLPTRKPD